MFTFGPIKSVDGIVEELMSLWGSAVSDPQATCNAVLPNVQKI